MRNPFEKRVAAQLGPTYEYEAIKLPYVIQHHYVPDFIDRSTKTIVEAKGLWDAADRRKLRAVKEAHPDWTIKLVFTNPYKTISKTSRTTYALYCEKHGFQWEQGPLARAKRK